MALVVHAWLPVKGGRSDVPIKPSVGADAFVIAGVSPNARSMSSDLVAEELAHEQQKMKRRASWCPRLYIPADGTEAGLTSEQWVLTYLASLPISADRHYSIRPESGCAVNFVQHCGWRIRMWILVFIHLSFSYLYSYICLPFFLSHLSLCIRSCHLFGVSLLSSLPVYTVLYCSVETHVTTVSRLNGYRCWLI